MQSGESIIRRVRVASGGGRHGGVGRTTNLGSEMRSMALCTAETKEKRLTPSDSWTRSRICPSTRLLTYRYDAAQPHACTFIAPAAGSDGQGAARVALSCASPRSRPCSCQQSGCHVLKIHMNLTCRYRAQISRHLPRPLSGGGRFHGVVQGLQLPVIAGLRKPPSNHPPGTFGRSHICRPARPP